MNLLFLDFDFEVIRKYCLENKNKPYKTELKRLSLEKLEKWYYFFVVLRDDPEYKEYISRNLQSYSGKSLEYAILSVMVSDPGSEDETKAYSFVYERLQNTKKKCITETMKKIHKALEYSNKTFKVPPTKEEEKK